MSTFTDLGVRKDFITGLQVLGINTPSEIQEKTIPVLLQNNTDFIGLAQTGTGKTAAFGLPILHQIDPSNNASVLISFKFTSSTKILASTYFV